MADAQTHWERVYKGRKPQEVSWYECAPSASLALIEEAGLSLDAAILDVGGGTSKLAAHLVGSGYTNVTVLDISPAALELARTDLGVSIDRVAWIEADVRFHEFGGVYDLWHDRAVFHFMVDPADRERYIIVLRRCLRKGGHLILATFGPDGPTHCSGLPVDRYGPDQLLRVVGADFELVSSRLTEHRTPSGKRQQFLYAHLRRKIAPGRAEGRACG